jgi:hypothetical protein
MERRNDVIRIATKKLAKILDVSDMEAAHRVSWKPFFSLRLILEQILPNFFFIANEEFFRFLMLSLAILFLIHFFYI